MVAVMAGYMNPESFFPDLPAVQPGMLSGVLRMEKLRDYDKLMQEHFEMSEFEKQRKRNELEKANLDKPVQALEREYKTKGYLGKIPYAQDAAEASSRAGIEKSRYEELEKGPQAREMKKQEWRDKLNESERIKMERESKIMFEIVEGMKAYGPEWAQNRLQQYQKLGYQVDPRILDPQRQEQIRAGLMDNLEWAKTQRKAKLESGLRMEEQKLKDAAAERRTRITADAMKFGATTRANTASNRNANNVKSAKEVMAKAILEMPALDPDSPQYQEWADRFTAASAELLAAEAEDNPNSPLGVAYFGAARGNPQARERLEQIYKERLSRMPKGKGASKKQSSTQQTKDDPLGLR